MIGVTGDLSRRLSEHKSGLVRGFTRRYKTDRLVYIEEYGSILEARARERVLKRWRREWKFKLIEANNPSWRDLSDSSESCPGCDAARSGASLIRGPASLRNRGPASAVHHFVLHRDAGQAHSCLGCGAARSESKVMRR